MWFLIENSHFVRLRENIDVEGSVWVVGCVSVVKS